jgi:hypothetical protein
MIKLEVTIRLIKMMFSSSLPPVVCRGGGLMSYLRYLCLFAHSGVQHILCCVFVLFIIVLCTLAMLPFSLDGPFLIAPSVFSYVYLIGCIGDNSL